MLLEEPMPPTGGGRGGPSNCDLGPRGASEPGGPARLSKLIEAADCLLSKRGGDRDRSLGPRKSGGGYRDDITS